MFVSELAIALCYPALQFLERRQEEATLLSMPKVACAAVTSVLMYRAVVSFVGLDPVIASATILAGLSSLVYFSGHLGGPAFRSLQARAGNMPLLSGLSMLFITTTQSGLSSAG